MQKNAEKGVADKRACEFHEHQLLNMIFLIERCQASACHAQALIHILDHKVSFGNKEMQDLKHIISALQNDLKHCHKIIGEAAQTE